VLFLSLSPWNIVSSLKLWFFSFNKVTQCKLTACHLTSTTS
jgi:hypothetical protein